RVQDIVRIIEVRTRYDIPCCPVPMLGERLEPRHGVAANGPDIWTRARSHAPQEVVTGSDVGGAHNLPRGAVPVFGEGQAKSPLLTEANRPDMVAGHTRRRGQDVLP